MLELIKCVEEVIFQIQFLIGLWWQPFPISLQSFPRPMKSSTVKKNHIGSVFSALHTKTRTDPTCSSFYYLRKTVCNTMQLKNILWYLIKILFRLGSNFLPRTIPAIFSSMCRSLHSQNLIFYWSYFSVMWTHTCSATRGLSIKVAPRVLLLCLIKLP